MSRDSFFSTEIIASPYPSSAAIRSARYSYRRPKNAAGICKTVITGERSTPVSAAIAKANPMKTAFTATKLAIGDIAVAESLVQHDMDTSPLGDPVGLISGLNIINIPADEKVISTLIKGVETLENIKAVKGVIASGDQFIASEEKKKYIVDNFGAIVCEMEGASIAQVCYTNGVPFGVVRAVSDCADGSSHMDYGEFLPIAAANAAKLIEYFVAESE